jgi:hypothetical protein
MAITAVRCPVLGATVSRVEDFEGGVRSVICAEYDEATGTCRTKQRALEGGFLSQLLERVSEDSLASRTTRCDLL